MKGEQNTKKYSKTNRESNKGGKNNTNSIVQRGLTNMFLANSAEASKHARAFGFCVKYSQLKKCVASLQNSVCVVLY